MRTFNLCFLDEAFGALLNRRHLLTHIGFNLCRLQPRRLSVALQFRGDVFLHRTGPLGEILLELLPLLGVLGSGIHLALRWRVSCGNGLLRLTGLLELTLHRCHATLGGLYVVQQLGLAFLDRVELSELHSYGFR